jgi:hypothetical protein
LASGMSDQEKWREFGRFAKREAMRSHTQSVVQCFRSSANVSHKLDISD